MSEYRINNIIENVSWIWEIIHIEVEENTIKISKKKLMRVREASIFLKEYSKKYANGTIRKEDENHFLICLGVLIGIFKGTSLLKKNSRYKALSRRINSLVKLFIGVNFGSLNL